MKVSWCCCCCSCFHTMHEHAHKTSSIFYSDHRAQRHYSLSDTHHSVKPNTIISIGLVSSFHSFFFFFFVCLSVCFFDGHKGKNNSTKRIRLHSHDKTLSLMGRRIRMVQVHFLQNWIRTTTVFIASWLLSLTDSDKAALNTRSSVGWPSQCVFDLVQHPDRISCLPCSSYCLDMKRGFTDCWRERWTQTVS